MQARASQKRRREGGGVIIEFSIAITVLWLILAATLDLGRAFAAAHLLQSAARTAARELALRPLAWNADFDGQNGAIRDIFDPSYLVLRAQCIEDEAALQGRTPGEQLDFLLASEGLLLNRMLRPLMVYEEVAVGGAQQRLLRYPGTLLRASASTTPAQDSTCRTPFVVAIPEVDDTEGRVVFRGIVEELQPGAFRFGEATIGGMLPGTASVQLRYPFQAVGLSAWRIVDGVNRAMPVAQTDAYTVEGLGSGVRDGRQLIEATTIDALDALGQDGELVAYAQRGAGDPLPVYGGRLGLGSQLVLGQRVRPFRRVISAQAIAPREVVGGPAS